MKFFSFLMISVIFPINIHFATHSARDVSPIDKLKELLSGIAVYDYSSRPWLEDFRDLMREIYGSAGLMEKAEEQFDEFLGSDATVAGKLVVCRELESFATGKSVPVLISLLSDWQTAEMALNTLELIPDVSADKALRKSLINAEDWLKPGLIETIGNRKDLKSVKLIEKFVHHEDPLVSGAAVKTLGKIGGERAASAIGKLYKFSFPPYKWEVGESFLAIADQFYSSGKKEEAYGIYREILDDNPPTALRIPALQGTISDPKVEGGSLIYDMLDAGDEEMFLAVTPIVRDYPGELDFEKFSGLFTTLRPSYTNPLMIAFADRGEEKIRPFALEAISSENDQSQKAGMSSLLLLGNAGDVMVFAETAAGSEGDIQEFARKCLYEMKGQEADQVILDNLPEADPSLKTELVKGIASRNTVEGIPLLMEMINNSEQKVSLEAIRAAGAIGGPDILNELIGKLKTAGGRAERNELIKSIILVANKKTHPEDRSDEILEAVSEGGEDNFVIDLVEILGSLGNDKALPVLRILLTYENRDIQYAAIKALSAWPNDDPVMDLKEIAENARDLKKHSLALQGYIKLVDQSFTLSPDMKMSAYRKAFEKALNDDEKKLILSAVGGSGSVRGLEMVAGLLNDSKLGSEAEASFLTLLKNLPDRFTDEKDKWVLEALRISKDPEFKKSIEEIRDGEN